MGLTKTMAPNQYPNKNNGTLSWLLPLRRLKWSEIGLATASGCIKFTLATASDQNSCTRSGHLKGVWQLPFTLATASELWQLPLWQLPLTLATASDYS